MRTLKLNLFVIILSTLILSPSYGQTYNEIVIQAYSCAYIDNDYKKAAGLFDKAFGTRKAKSTELYYAAEINLKLDSIGKFMQFLSQSVDNGYANYDFLVKQQKYKTHFKDADWDSLLKKTKKNYLIFEEEYGELKESLSGYYHTSQKIIGKVDLRIDSLKVKHQGRRNTCSVFAATALIEYLIWDKHEKIIDLSESYNYWAAKTYALTNDFLKETYTSVDGLAGYLAVEAYKYGSMDEKNWKYENTNWLTDKDERCKTINGNYTMECFTGVPLENSKKSGFTAQTVFIDREDIGQYILQEKKPVAMNIFWYFDAIDDKGNFRLPTEKDIRKGGHVILLVGYNSENKTFIFQNSWGTKWGQDGYGTIPEEYIINYYELAETFPYGIDASEDEKNEAIKGSMGVSASLEN
ncbi:MAG: C1 family peptidase [Bacteroidales bacterium]|nr:C1 family peptidase [Bacteroidales bacterium]